MALFGRRPPQRVDSLVMPASENLHNRRHQKAKGTRNHRLSAAAITNLVSAQHQRLDRKQQGLNPQQQRVHEAGGVDDMQPEALQRTDLA